jgi:hypothetical protein
MTPEDQFKQLYPNFTMPKPGGSPFGGVHLRDKPLGSGLVDESKSAKDQRYNLNNQGGMSSWFADQGQENFGALGAEATGQRQYLRDLAAGKNSVSAEQLRQGLQQNLAGQRSMAASASPQNAAMAARSAANNSARLGYGMSGQAAVAGMQERNDANKMLAELIMRQREQELQAALQSRQNAIGAYGGVKPEKSTLEKYAPLINAGVGALSAV